MLTNLFSKPFFSYLLAFALAEIISYLAWLGRGINFGLINFSTLIFILVSLAFVYLTWRRLDWGVFLIISEIIIGVHGYLFFGKFGSINISLRMAFFGLLLIIWLIKSNWPDKTKIWQSNFWPFFGLYLFLIVWGVLRAWQGNNQTNLIVKDFQPWLYVFLLPVFISVLKTKEHLKTILQLILAGAGLIAAQTIILAGLFARWPNFALANLYPWLRLDYLAEVTKVSDNFFRFFSAGQIYTMFGWTLSFILLFFIFDFKLNKKNWLIAAAFFVVTSSALLLSLSRTFWLALFFVLLCLIIIALKQFKLKSKQSLIFAGQLILLFIAANLITFIFTNVLVLNPFGSTLNQRLSSTEVAVSSRNAQFIPLAKAINQHSLIGSGWGKTFVFKNSDPRVLANSPSGLYVAFKSEWGYLDFWLKFGFMGLVILFFILLKYLWFFMARFKKAEDKEIKYSALFCFSSLLGLMVAHATSPYLNHPLGITWLIIEAVFVFLWVKLYVKE